MIKHDNLYQSGPSYSYFRPACCSEHKNRCVKRKHMDTSKWQFEKNLKEAQKYDPWSWKMPSTQRKIASMKNLDKSIERMRTEKLYEEIDRIKANVEEERDVKEEQDVSKKVLHFRDSRETSRSKEIMKEIQKMKMHTNPYLVLLNRLDEEQGVRSPSIEDKLKLAEDRLRVCTVEFCKAVQKLATAKDSDLTESPQTDTLVRPETVQEYFRSKIFDPSLRPPRTLLSKEFRERAYLQTWKTKTQDKVAKKKEDKMKEILKQGYYLPADTWFVSANGNKDMSPEELELLNSTATKTFLKFLAERMTEPPKVLHNMQKQLEDMLLQKKNISEIHKC